MLTIDTRMRGHHPEALRIAALALGLLVITLGHWLIPVEPLGMHALHVVLRKLFLIPVIVAAVWFGLRGSLITAGVVTLFFLPHIWSGLTGDVSENLNQYGELVTVFSAAFVAGILVGHEKRALHEVAEVHEGALVSLVAALDAREHDTQTHSLRVRSYSLRIGKAMRLNRKDLAILGEGALLHDIGKIGVPDGILLKPGPLTAAEWQVVRKHPEIGRRILEEVPFLQQPAKIVGAHHEKYDGTGYPKGLAGDQIPLGARIFAVADAFDALTNDRPYHRGVADDEAKRTIEEGSGRHFDPRVVQSFLSLPVGDLDRVTGQELGGVPAACQLGQAYP